jgi:4-amino-4-deoxy-L-arabinose transferase-like glycosyltransferase
LLGVQSSASAIAAIVLNALCSSLVSVVLYRIGSEFLSERTGLTAGVLWAVSPAVALVTLLVWDTCLTTLLATWACLLTLRLAFADRSQNWRSYFVAGGLWGLAGLSSPSVLAPLPFLALWLWAKSRQFKPAAIFSTAVGLVLVPWTLRNFFVFHKLIPVRDNFWAEVFFGNIGFQTHPLKSSMEYQRLGELQFIENSKQQVLLYIHDHFAEFVEQTLHRIGQFWILPEGLWGLSFFLSLAAFAGLCVMAKRKLPAVFPFLIVLAAYPVTYYISYTFSRYRHPVEPVMYMSAAFLLVEIAQRLQRKKPLVELET